MFHGRSSGLTSGLQTGLKFQPTLNKGIVRFVLNKKILVLNQAKVSQMVQRSVVFNSF